jgi:hypothetical protein
MIFIYGCKFNKKISYPADKSRKRNLKLKKRIKRHVKKLFFQESCGFTVM